MQSARGRTLATVLLALALAGCADWSWNPAKWSLFNKEPEPAPPVVEVLAIESLSPNPAADRFSQSWDGVRLVIDVQSDAGIGRAVLKPREAGWPLRMAFRLHLRALEGLSSAQTLRFGLGYEPLTEPAFIDLPPGAYTKDSTRSKSSGSTNTADAGSPRIAARLSARTLTPSGHASCSRRAAKSLTDLPIVEVLPQLKAALRQHRVVLQAPPGAARAPGC
jgi:hypothetical protein